MTMFKRNLLSLLAGAGLLSIAAAASAQVVGGGATLPEDLYNEVMTKSPLPAFNTYIGVGSGAGKRAFFNNNAVEFGLTSGITVDYAGSDSLVTATERDTYIANNQAAYGPLVVVPSVLTSVPVTFNVPGMTSLSLTSAQLAGIFAGTITNWNQVGGPNHAIVVVYRTEGSGTTEIFLRHLNAVNSSLVPSVNNTFSSVINTSGSNYLGATGSDGVAAAILANTYSIGYVSPDKVDFDNPAVVASINGYLPTEVNVQAAIANVPVPASAADKADPLKWGISNPNPSTGYPVVASTNLLFSQCYLSTTDNARIRAFVNQQYNGTNDAAIASHSFIALPQAWKDAILATFYTSTSALSIGNASVCAGIGRPL
jgi:ABC-type phosphate transport system substrate-binding protein